MNHKYLTQTLHEKKKIRQLSNFKDIKKAVEDWTPIVHGRRKTTVYQTLTIGKNKTHQKLPISYKQQLSTISLMYRSKFTAFNYQGMFLCFCKFIYALLPLYELP